MIRWWNEKLENLLVVYCMNLCLCGLLHLQSIYPLRNRPSWKTKTFWTSLEIFSYVWSEKRFGFHLLVVAWISHIVSSICRVYCRHVCVGEDNSSVSSPDSSQPHLTGSLYLAFYKRKSGVLIFCCSILSCNTSTNLWGALLC